MSELNVTTLGQVFTPSDIVDLMLGMMKNTGPVLEPSCGNGAFLEKLLVLDRDIVGIEIDKTVAHSKAEIIDFFNYNPNKLFSTIIGNPPYVKYQNIQDSTKTLLLNLGYDKRTNLSVFFIDKCIELLDTHGELIFIVPRDFLNATSAQKLNNKLYERGTITDLIDLGDKKIFKNAAPNCIIFRWEKDKLDHITNGNLIFKNINGQLVFLEQDYPVPMNKLFEVKVGAVSGADQYFISELGNKEFVCSTTAKDGKTRRMFYNTPAKELEPFKAELLKRRLKKFDETNWYKWGRDYPDNDKPRIYVNQKTRNEKPFFVHSCNAWDGSILAVFPKFKVQNSELELLAEELNGVDWKDLGFVCDGRYIFSQRSLENTCLPKNFEKYLNRLEEE